jgi:hypothetical protein
MLRSTMNLDSLLNGLQTARGQLDAWGLTNRLLLVAGLVSLALLVWSLRELAVWFFKVQALRSEVADLHVKLDRALELLEGKQPPPLIVEVPAEPSKPEVQAFRLDH